MKTLTTGVLVTLAVAGSSHSTAGSGPRTFMADLSQDIFPPDQQSPEALQKFQQAEMDKWWPIIKAAGIKAQ